MNQPVHLAVPGTNRTLCGLGGRRGPAVPYASAAAANTIAADRVCPECRDAIDAYDPVVEVEVEWTPEVRT